MKIKTFGKPRKQILLFNKRTKLLVSICESMNTAAKMMKISHANISKCCAGERECAGGFYVKPVVDGIELEQSDLGKLTMKEYEQIQKEQEDESKGISEE